MSISKLLFKKITTRGSKMNSVQRDMYQYSQFPKGKQYALINPENPNEFKTFFLIHNYVSNRTQIIGETPNWVYGEVPPGIQVIHPMRYSKIKSGTSL